MPIYINDNEHALFKGDEKTSVCMIHGSNMSRPNAYYFESCEHNEDITSNDSNNVHKIPKFNNGSYDAGLDYRPWVRNRTVLTYSRDDNCPITNWSQKGIVRCFKDKFNINFYNSNNLLLTIKGSFGNNSIERRYTVIPLTALGEKLFTSTDADVINLKEGNYPSTFKENFQNETRHFSYVAICCESYNQPNYWSYISNNLGRVYTFYGEAFSPFQKYQSMVVLKQMCQDGVDRPSGESKYKVGYNALTHTYAVTLDDIQNIPPFLWRYSYIVDCTDMHIDPDTYNADTGDCWWLFHKTYMTNNGDNYFDKYLKNKTNFFVYLDYRKCEAIREVTSSKNTQTYLVTKENQNAMIEEYFLGTGKLVTFTNLTDSSLSYMKYNFWGDFGEKTLTYKKSTYPQVSFDLHYLECGGANILNIIMNFFVRVLGTGTKYTYKKKLTGSYGMSIQDGMISTRGNVVGAKNTIISYFKSNSEFKAYPIVCRGSVVKNEVIYGDDGYEILHIVSDKEFKKYNCLKINSKYPAITNNYNYFDNLPDGDVLKNSNYFYIHINGGDYMFKLNYQTDIYDPTSSPNRYQISFRAAWGTSGSNRNIFISEAHLFFWIYENIVKGAKYVGFGEEIMALCDDIAYSGIKRNFQNKMPKAYELLNEWLKEYTDIYFYMKNDEVLNVSNAKALISDMGMSGDKKLVLDANLDGYDCIFPPIFKPIKNDMSQYDSYTDVVKVYTEEELGMTLAEFTVDMQLYDIQVAKKNG